MSRVEVIGGATLLLGDWRHCAPTHVATADAIVTDPPYGIAFQTRRRSPRNGGLKWDKALATESAPAIAGDHEPFDPAPFLGCRKIALFGAQHFYSRLPAGGRFVVWDKRRGSTRDDHGDGDLVWLKGAPGVVRIHHQKWRGICREGEENVSRGRKLHRFQKPIALVDYLLDMLQLPPGATVLDPFMGSGTTGAAALRRGLMFVGAEIDPAVFDVAVSRLAAESERLQSAAASALVEATA